MRAEVHRGAGSEDAKAREFVPSTALIYQVVLEQIEKLRPHSEQVRHLDIGAGSGRLLKLVRDRFGFAQSGCDYTAQFMKHSDVAVDLVDLDHQPLPYPDSSFDLVTCVETIAHFENFQPRTTEI